MKYLEISLVAILAISLTSGLEVENPIRDANVSTIRFYLWTRLNPGKYDYQELFVDDNESILGSNFDGGKKTKILVHGYTDSGLESFYDWIENMVNAYLQNDDCNVISVDWEVIANLPYVEAVQALVPSGAYTGDLIRSLMEVAGASLEDFHAIGFSLGAQFVGALGLAMDKKMTRITGLDPAGPEFFLYPPDQRLSEDDAELVDVIHTATPALITYGDIDFYPNLDKVGGVQPGCEVPILDSIDCSHQRAPVYMSESINSEVGFLALECASRTDFEAGLCDNSTTNLMGETVDASKRGTFYLSTNAEAPFAIDLN